MTKNIDCAVYYKRNREKSGEIGENRGKSPVSKNYHMHIFEDVWPIKSTLFPALFRNIDQTVTIVTSYLLCRCRSSSHLCVKLQNRGKAHKFLTFCRPPLKSVHPPLLQLLLPLYPSSHRTDHTVHLIRSSPRTTSQCPWTVIRAGRNVRKHEA